MVSRPLTNVAAGYHQIGFVGRRRRTEAFRQPVLRLVHLERGAPPKASSLALAATADAGVRWSLWTYPGACGQPVQVPARVSVMPPLHRGQRTLNGSGGTASGCPGGRRRASRRLRRRQTGRRIPVDGSVSGGVTQRASVGRRARDSVAGVRRRITGAPPGVVGQSPPRVPTARDDADTRRGRQPVSRPLKRPDRLDHPRNGRAWAPRTPPPSRALTPPGEGSVPESGRPTPTPVNLIAGVPQRPMAASGRTRPRSVIPCRMVSVGCGRGWRWERCVGSSAAA